MMAQGRWWTGDLFENRSTGGTPGIVRLAGALCLISGLGMGCAASEKLPGVGGDGADTPAGDTASDDLDGDTYQPPLNTPFAVLTLNLHCLKNDGTQYASHQERLTAVAAAVYAEDVAAIAVQEACNASGVDTMALLEAAIEAATGDTWSSTWAFSHMAWQGTADEAEEGVGILARGTLTAPSTTIYHVQGGLQRVALAATLDAALGEVRLHTVHLDHENGGVRHAQARESVANAVTEVDPSLRIIMAGDLNDKEGSDTHGSFHEFGFVDLTDALDDQRIDHIFTHRASGLGVTHSKRIFTGETYPTVSDHPGVLVSVSPETPAAVVVTRIDVSYQTPSEQYLTVRGDTAPLSWDKGWPMLPVEGGLSRLVMTEMANAAFEYKVLIDDSAWQTGENAVGLGGGDSASAPAF